MINVHYILENPSISSVHITKPLTAQPCTDNGETNMYLILKTVILPSCPFDIPQGSIPSTTVVHKENTKNCDCSSLRNVSHNSTRLFLSHILVSKTKPSSPQTNPVASSGQELPTRSFTARNLETPSQTNTRTAAVTNLTKSLQVSLEISLTSQNFPFTIVESSMVPPKTTINLVCSDKGEYDFTKLTEVWPTILFIENKNQQIKCIKTRRDPIQTVSPKTLKMATCMDR